MWQACFGDFWGSEVKMMAEAGINVIVPTHRDVTIPLLHG